MGTTDVTLYAKWTDNVAPTVTLDLPATYTSLTVPVTIVPSETNVKYFFIEGPTPTSGLVPQDPTPPYTNAPGWITTLPTSYDFRAAGSRTLFVWVKDAAENVSTGLVSDVVVITLPDTTPPTITATSSNTTPLAIGETTTLTFTLSSASTNFTQDDITVVGGTLSQWTAVSSTVYTARFTPDTNRTTAGTINVAAGRFTNASGTSNTAMTQLSIQIDTVAPVTPAALTIPAQTGVTAWYYVTTDTFTVRVACTLGYTNKIYSRTIAAPTPVIINTTVCTNSTYMDVVINPGQESDFYSLSTTITDTAGNASGQSNLINIYKDLPETAVTVP